MIADRDGLTAGDRVAVASFVRARRGEREYRELARQARKRLATEPERFNELLTLSTSADGAAQKCAGEARMAAKALKIDPATRSNRAARKAKGFAIDLADLGEDDEP